jgi:hypothetical protein
MEDLNKRNIAWNYILPEVLKRQSNTISVIFLFIGTTVYHQHVVHIVPSEKRTAKLLQNSRADWTCDERWGKSITAALFKKRTELQWGFVVLSD